jgi:hypothetical protein
MVEQRELAEQRIKQAVGGKNSDLSLDEANIESEIDFNSLPNSNTRYSK